MMTTEDKIKLAKFLLDDAYNDLESGIAKGDKEKMWVDVDEIEDIVASLLDEQL